MGDHTDSSVITPIINVAMQRITISILIIILLVNNGYAIYQNSCNNVASRKDSATDQVIDAILESLLEKHGDKLDPLTLPDLGFSFERTILFITYSGRVGLHDGKLEGLRTLHRDGKSTLSTHENDICVSVKAAMGPLRFDYKGSLVLIGFGPTLDYYGSIEYLSVDIVINKNKDKKLKMERFKVRKLKGLELKIGKLGPLNPLVKLLTRPALSLFKSSLHSLLEHNVKKMFEEIVSDFDLPTNIEA